MTLTMLPDSRMSLGASNPACRPPAVEHIARRTVFITVLAALTIGILAVARRRVRRAGASLVPWLVSLAIGVVTTTPQIATAHYKHVAGAVFAGVFWSLLVALYLRFVIFLADYFRRSRPLSGAGVRS